AVERTARELHELTGEAEPRRLQGEESERWWTEPAAGADVAVRASLPPSAVVDFLERFARSARDVNADVTSRAYPPTGLVLARLRASDADRTVRVVEEARRAAVQAGGSLVVTSAPVEVKERVDIWGDPGSALPLMRRLKQQFDPNGTLNPGRFVGGL
ncbi:MAG: FAD-linked oxidase C-terminal domain-containing protein, partial [Dehalococcoidia bacterium]|nr:FAD-linked oxidase C-terminal domain-containing protein [Dehalococcoidia bacterium]